MNNAFTESQISAAGRILADRSAEACNVDKDDNWKVYGDDFIEDARAALNASGVASTIAALKEQLAGARNAALEEVAAWYTLDTWFLNVGDTKAAIRALASQPAAPVQPTEAELIGIVSAGPDAILHHLQTRHADRAAPPVQQPGDVRSVEHDQPTIAVEERFQNVWNDALEEAALICDGVNNHDNPMTAGDCADEIRALKGRAIASTTTTKG